MRGFVGRQASRIYSFDQLPERFQRLFGASPKPALSNRSIWSDVFWWAEKSGRRERDAPQESLEEALGFVRINSIGGHWLRPAMKLPSRTLYGSERVWRFGSGEAVKRAARVVLGLKFGGNRRAPLPSAALARGRRTCRTKTCRITNRYGLPPMHTDNPGTSLPTDLNRMRINRAANCRQMTRTPINLP